MAKICCIDGNIGAGKSTVLDEIESRGFYVFREDIEKWKWCLDKFYDDPNRWAFTLQLAVLNSSYEQWKQISKLNAPFVFIERSPMSRLVFASVGYKRGYLSPDEVRLFKELNEKFGWSPDFIMVLNTPADECFRRIRARDRNCEQNIDISYLYDLENEYQNLKKTHILRNGTPEDVADRILDFLS